MAIPVMLERQRIGANIGPRSVQVAVASFTAESTTNAPIFAVPKETVIVDMICNITSLFADSSTLEIGDGTDTDGYIINTRMADTATGMKRMTDTDSAYINGKWYDTDDTIDIAMAPNSSTLGAADVYCFYIPALV